MSFDLAPGPRPQPPPPPPTTAAKPIAPPVTVADPKPAIVPTPTAIPSATATATATAAATTTATPTAAAAATGTPTATPDTRGTSFQAVENEPEAHSGEGLLVSAYSVLWVILMGWLVLVWKKQAGLNVRLDGLERAIDRAVAKAEKAGGAGAGADKKTSEA